MRTQVEATVLFARLGGDFPAGLAQLDCAARACGAWVVKTLPDKLMLLADAPDAAADVAAAMHGALGSEARVGARAPLSVGFHHGPVIRYDADVHGGTVNLAARIADRAAVGTILTTEATARRLGAPYRAAMRSLGALRVRGVSGEVALCELVWRADGEATLAPAASAAAPAASMRGSALSLYCSGQERHFPGAAGEIVVGRDPACDLVVPNQLASRRHCTIERRQDGYVLSDHSANGTWVSVNGRETRLHREDLVLGRRGRIAFGQSAAEGGETVVFACD